MPAKRALSPALEAFFQAIEKRTTDPVHRRLVAAARRKDPAVSLDREFERIMQELTNET